MTTIHNGTAEQPAGTSGQHHRRLRALAAALLCGTTLAMSAMAAQAAEDSIRILTLNTWLDRFKPNPAVAADFFIKGNYDVLTFQEFRANSTYARDLPGLMQAASLGTYGTRQDSDVGVFSRLPGTFGAFTSGAVATYTKVDATAKRPQTIVGTTHLNYYDEPTNRISQAKALNNWARAQTGPLILTGDFNAGDVSERGLHSISQQERLLRIYTKNPTNAFYLSLLRQYAKDQTQLDAFIAQWKGKPGSQIDAATVPSGLFANEMYPVAGNLPQTMNILKKQYQLLQLPNEREQFSPHALNDGSVTWPSHGEDATNTWGSWHRVKIDHFLASRPFGKWWTIKDDPADPYLGVITDVSYVTNPDGSKTPMSDHEPVAHNLRWVGPQLETYDDNGTAKTRLVWGKDASTFGEKGKEFFLSRNNMRDDVYLGQISDDNGMPLLAGLTDAEKKTLLDCKSTDARLQQAIRDYCIDDHSFIGETRVADGGTVIVEEDAALGGEQAKLRLDGGSLRVAGTDMHVLGRNVVLEAGGGSLDIAAAGNVLGINKAISGAGNLTKLGLGTLLLDGTHSYTGETIVKAGALSVQGSIASSKLVTIGAGGMLGGIGTLGNTVVASGGTLAPGNSIGTIKVSGDITFEAGSTFEIEANDKGESDKVAATGMAILKGGSVLTLATGNNYAPQTLYKIVTADGGVTGSFANVSSNLAFLDPSLAYGANDVTLTLNRNDITFADVGTTPNQKAAAAALESTGFGNAAYAAVVNLDEAGAQQAFGQLSGEVHASTQGMMMQDGGVLLDVATSRIDQAFGDTTAASMPVMAYGDGGLELAPADTDRFALWSRAFGSWGSTNGDGNAMGFDRSSGGLVGGADAMVGDSWRVGVLAGYSRSSFDAADGSSNGSSDNYHVGITAGTRVGAFGLTAGATYSWHRFDTARSVAFTGFSDALTAKYDGGTAQLFGEASYKVDAGRFAIEGFSNLSYVNLRTDAFTETGGAAALSSQATSNDVTFTTLGVRASTDVALGAVNATVRGTIGWRHAFGDVTPVSSMAFAGSDGFEVAGTPIARNAAVLGAGIDFDIAPKAKLGISYTGQLSNGASDHGIDAKLAVSF
ncbi:autotransporter domain-containing protein [Aminobacter aminovorans]|uniref:autotransporter domain-containing protein n=1 Tax=Aminobacter aminovorans TaxID=83263 RepID=UPI00286536EC|nr:autotransporter domain-containing protein [Aminobacter aminovorans]MDR7224222.1 outer membrane autotransporter protein [Aminobacter aminovorans]